MASRAWQRCRVTFRTELIVEASASPNMAWRSRLARGSRRNGKREPGVPAIGAVLSGKFLVALDVDVIDRRFTNA